MIIKEVNTSKKYYTGSRWKSNNGGMFTVLGKCTNRGYYKIIFDDVGFGKHQTYASDAKILSGKVKNRLCPSLYGVGYMGDGAFLSKKDGKVAREYRLWTDMMKRCYSMKYISKYPSYRGCTVCTRWHNYQYFCDDIKRIEGYSKWLAGIVDMQLDKDIKVAGNKIYSLSTCTFVSAEENSKAIVGRHKCKYRAIRVCDAYTEEISKVTEFANKYELCTSSIYRVLSGKFRECNGWRFEIVEDKNGSK